MLFDVILFIPTLCTYVLILLLICILCFIIVYISHKVYISIYDNLPLNVGLDAGVKQFSEKLLSVANQPSSRSFWIGNKSIIYDVRTSKAYETVRFTISVEPCYLAYLELYVLSLPGRRAISLFCDCCNPSGSASCNAAKPHSHVTLIKKYYDKLAKIPRFKLLTKCTERSMESHIGSNMQQLIDEVIRDAYESRHKVSQVTVPLLTRTPSSQSDMENR